jgi:ABC-type multidrug transport system ATPase subunit
LLSGNDHEEIDEDVAAENERIANGSSTIDDIIVINKLTKYYPNGTLAVNKVSLGIPLGQCFGLLGINGAGKTTMLGMLTAEFPSTSGDAILDGFSVTTQPELTRRKLGYCPQFDAHFTNMTGREHVELYATIKGLPKDKIHDAASK